MRSAGSPTSTATSAPTMPPVNITAKKSHPWVAASMPDTPDATPEMAYCPSEICPVQPVRTTSDTPTMA